MFLEELTLILIFSYLVKDNPRNIRGGKYMKVYIFTKVFFYTKYYICLRGGEHKSVPIPKKIVVVLMFTLNYFL